MLKQILDINSMYREIHTFDTSLKSFPTSFHKAIAQIDVNEHGHNEEQYDNYCRHDPVAVKFADREVVARVNLEFYEGARGTIDAAARHGWLLRETIKIQIVN